MDDVNAPPGRRERMVTAGAEALYQWHLQRFGGMRLPGGGQVSFAGLHPWTREAYEIGALRVLETALRVVGEGELLARDDGPHHERNET